jgi:hypothetical protein
MRHFPLWLVVPALLAGLGLCTALLVGTLASAPARVAIGAPPPDLPIASVSIESKSGSWLVELPHPNGMFPHQRLYRVSAAMAVASIMRRA